jgi:hypothetical protein
MRPSTGVIVSAIIGVIGSLVSILFGVMMVFTMRAALAPSVGHPAPAIPLGAIFGIMTGVYAGFGAWGIVSAIGLLRLRNWARICFAVFGGILAVFSLFGAFGMVIGLLAPSGLGTQPPPNVSPELMTGVFAVFAVIALLNAALGIWWMIYFNRSRVKAQFMGETAAAAPRLFPLSITIIAWFLILGGVNVWFMFLLPFPMVLFGFVFRGWAGRLIAALFAGVSLFAGIGMLKKRVVANSAAIGYFVFGLLNTISFWVVPGSFARMQEAMQEVAGGQNLQVDISSAPYRLMMLLPAAGMGIALWFLISRRHAFTDEPRIERI